MASFWMENALLGESDIMTGIRRGTFVRDDCYQFIVRTSDDGEDREAKFQNGFHVPTNSYNPVGLAPTSALTSGLIRASSSSSSFFL